MVELTYNYVDGVDPLEESEKYFHLIGLTDNNSSDDNNNSILKQISEDNNRIFGGWGSVEIVDRQGEFLPLDELKSIMPILIERGANIIDSHTNHKVGEIIDYEFKKHPDGEEGLYLTGKIYNHYPTDDEVWEKIKSHEYTGFSIGGKAGDKKVTCNHNGCFVTIRDIEAWEFSVVEKPANQKSLIDNVNKIAKNDNIEKYIRRRNNEWCVFSRSGKKLGCHPTKDKANNQLRAIEANKGIQKEKVYIDTPSEAPKGMVVRRGPKGGLYYETKPSKSESPKEKPEKQTDLELKPKEKILSETELRQKFEEEYGTGEEVYSKWIEYKGKWRHQIHRKLSLGEISQKEAENLGWHNTSGYNTINRLPETLYHVTTARDAIINNGIKTREELNMQSGIGLGGGTSDTISFTESYDLAKDILKVMKEAREVASGNITITDLINMSKAGTGAKKPWYDELIRAKYINNATKWLEQGKQYYWRNFLEDDPGPEWVPIDKENEFGKHYEYIRTLTSNELHEKTFEFYKKWLYFRQDAGGPEDPLFFGSDVNALSKVNPNQISILKFNPKQNAQGYQLGALGEWRTWTGDAVELTDVINKNMKKERRYITSPQEAPQGARIHRGEHGGLYYETEERESFVSEVSSIEEAVKQEHNYTDEELKSVLDLNKSYEKMVKSEFPKLYNNISKYGNVSYRIKNPYSMLSKMKKKGEKVQDLYDVFGVRLQVNSLEEINNVKEVIKSIYSDKILEERDYIKNPKGIYRSLHYIIDYGNNLKGEIQIRTPLMDKIAIASHILVYKNTTGLSEDIKHKINDCFEEYFKLEAHEIDRVRCNPSVKPYLREFGL